jgi:hypothetical protein
MEPGLSRFCFFRGVAVGAAMWLLGRWHPARMTSVRRAFIVWDCYGLFAAGRYDQWGRDVTRYRGALSRPKIS